MSTYEWEVEASGTLQYVYADTESMEVAYNPPVTSSNLSSEFSYHPPSLRLSNN